MNNRKDLSWPPFLDILDSHPKKAADEFYRYISKLVEITPPKMFLKLSKSEKEEVIQEIVLYYIDKDFRVLKKYENKSRPFAAWIYFKINNMILDYMDAPNQQTVSLDKTDYTETSSLKKQNNNYENKELLGIVNKCILTIDDYCRLLLRMASDEYKPQEMAKLLREPLENGKKISNKLAYCRKKLTDMLVVYGVNIDELKI